MELHQLRYFLAIAEHSSIVKASERLHVSQSALSVALKDLEHELGFPLFDRTGRRLRINGNGRYFAEQVHAAFATISDAQESITHDLEKRRSTVLCSTNMTLGRVGEVMIRAFRKRYPHTILRIGFRGSPLFAHATPDLEFFCTPQKLEPTERLTVLGYEHFVAVLPTGWVSDDSQEICLRDLRDRPFILPGPGVMQDIITGMFEEAGFEPDIVSEIQLYTEVLNLVRAGIGYTVAPELTWLDGMWGLAVYPITDIVRGRNLYASVPERTSSPAALELLEFLRSEAPALLKQERDSAEFGAYAYKRTCITQ